MFNTEKFKLKAINKLSIKMNNKAQERKREQNDRINYSTPAYRGGTHQEIQATN